MKAHFFLIAGALGLLFSLYSLTALAETPRALPSSREQVQLSYAPIVKNAAPAVVNIYTRKVVRERVHSPFMNDPFFQHFFGGTFPQGGAMRQRLENSLGSGVLVKPDGLIVTSNHVISGADEITVVLSDRREFEAKAVINDERADLAVLRVEAKGEALPYLEIKDSDEAEVGDMVLAIGNPFGVGQTVTSGIISATARTDLDINDLNYFIQTDAAINPGNSGGALVTMDGKLIGINTAIYSRDGGNMGIGFAVPSNMVRTLISSAGAGEKKLARPWTGIAGQAVTVDIANSLGLARPVGLLVNSVHKASPAAKAGLKVGDVIVGVGGKPVDGPAAFSYRIATMQADSLVELEVFRSGQRTPISFKLTPPPEIPAREETPVSGRTPLSGVTLANMSPAVAHQYNLPEGGAGVVVVNVAANTPAARLGLRLGDAIVQINGEKIETVKDAQKALQMETLRWRMTIRRGEELVNMMVGR